LLKLPQKGWEFRLALKLSRMPIQLRAHVSTLIRKRWPNLLRVILVGDPRSWPPHLQLAWTALRESGLLARQVRILVHNALTAGIECARRMNERTQAAEVCERSRKVKAAFGRLSHCAKRAPAKLRHMLDESISAVLESGDVDLEVIEALFQTSRTVFEQFPDAEATQSALSALGIDRKYAYDAIGLTVDFSSLSPPLQENCKSALSLAIKSGAGTGAVAVFKALADGVSDSPRPPRGASDIVIDYVAAVAAEWRSSGLRAGRALKSGNASYKSKFHRFCDLVLTVLVEPDSRRHQEGLDQLSEKAWARQRRLPREDRKYVRGGLPRKDSQWLVTAHCLREGLRLANSKKRPRDSI
jgi:hypothetical protein